MVFSSGVFLFAFLPCLLILYYFVKSLSLRNYILLASSLLFYAWGEPVFIFIMLAAIVINWLIALVMNSRKFLLVIAVLIDLSLLGVFKYASFIAANLNYELNIALPIGISFFTFQMMSYIFDVYYGKSKAQRNLLYVALYISFFPQLIAGPIVRYNQIESEISERHEDFANFSEGVRRFIYGLGKKVLLANFLAVIADNIFGYIINPSVLMSWLGAIAYTMQIYFDFSGYSDMAIGLGLMFGFHFEENFNYPYTASSVTDFWHRWHISLSAWFRDYVYIPLGGSRVSKSRHILNIFTVWLLTGIWHGANWTFMLWGLIYFAVLIIEKETRIIANLKVFSHVWTLLIIILAWVIFRSESISQGINYISGMFGLNANAFYDGGFIFYIKGSWVVLIAALTGCLPFMGKLIARIKWLEVSWLALVLAVSLCEIVSSSYNPFIYFNF